MKKLTGAEREALLLELLDKLYKKEMTQGKVLRYLRKDYLEFNQDKYAKLVKISRRTLSDIENDTGQQTQMVLNKAFRPFNIQMQLVPTDISVLNNIL